MRKNISSIIGGVFLVVVLFMTSCTKMDHYYKDYVVERTYIGKPDSIWVQPGNQRVQIGILTPKDPAATKLVVRYGGDSSVMNIDRTIDVNTMLIENLDERDYLFNAYTVDDSGNRSLMMELNTPVFGSSFASTLRERTFSHSVRFGDSLAVVWNSAALFPENFIGTELGFTDRSGESHIVFVSKDDNVSILHNPDINLPVTIQSLYSPHENAFENFYTTAEELDVVASRRTSLTFSSTTYTDAMYIDFKYVQMYLEANVPTPVGADIDMCYALGAGSRGNLFSMDGTGFSAFASNWQAAINAWDVRNYARLKLDRTAAAKDLYEALDENNRQQMIDAYEGSAGAASTRLSSLAVGDIIFLHSADREIYVAMKVVGTPPAVSGALGDFTIEFKVSRP